MMESISMIKWHAILAYWLWLSYRNIQTNKDNDWRLWVQILINTAVIAVIVLEEVLWTILWVN